MSTKNEILKVSTITLFMLFCLQPFFDNEYREYIIGGFSGISYIELAKLISYLFVIMFLIICRGKISDSEKITEKKWMKWLYVIPIVFFAAVTIRRIGFLSTYFEKFTQDLRGAYWFFEGYTVDYNRFLRETAFLLFMFVIINSLVMKRKENSGNCIGKSAFVAATLFAVLAAWLFYKCIVYAVYYGVYHDYFSGIRDNYWLQLVILCCGYGLAAFSLFKGSRKFIIVCIGALLLYIVCYNSSPYYISGSILKDICYLSGCICIILYFFIAWVSGRKERVLKSKLWFLLPTLFFVVNLLYYIRECVINESCKINFIWDYQSVVQDFAILFTILWVIYPDGLPFGAGFFQDKRQNIRKGNKEDEEGTKDGFM